jgi:hypothetical protein
VTAFAVDTLHHLDRAWSIVDAAARVPPDEPWWKQDFVPGTHAYQLRHALAGRHAPDAGASAPEKRRSPAATTAAASPQAKKAKKAKKTTTAKKASPKRPKRTLKAKKTSKKTSKRATRK